MTSKIAAYIGFAVKGRKLLYGLNNIGEYRKRIYILISCPSGSENVKKQSKDFAVYRNLPLLMLCDELRVEMLANKTNCKVIAITDGNLSKAILENCEDSYTRIV